MPRAWCLDRTGSLTLGTERHRPLHVPGPGEVGAAPLLFIRTWASGLRWLHTHSPTQCLEGPQQCPFFFSLPSLPWVSFLPHLLPGCLWTASASGPTCSCARQLPCGHCPLTMCGLPSCDLCSDPAPKRQEQWSPDRPLPGAHMLESLTVRDPEGGPRKDLDSWVPGHRETPL